MEISIKKPCHENWESMTLNEQGAFCGKCVKTVIDFSAKSLDEIKIFFELKQNEKVCGRFETQQLTSLSFDAFFNEFKEFNFTKRFAVIVYFTFGMWLFGASSATGQTTDHLKGDVEVRPTAIMGGVRALPTQKDTIKTCEKPDRETKVIKGKVAVKQKPVEELKIGEVSAEPPKKKKSAKKATPKK
ncbi:MAG: hypothetical protein K0S53_1875 [Bacteroidetes bacterium]|jgi:hypothetical protein|nr:hypothetical protein [Bacteroidota bacterium]